MVLSGAKQFTTNGARAGMAIVSPVTDPELGRRVCPRSIVRITNTPDLTLGGPSTRMGIRASDYLRDFS